MLFEMFAKVRNDLASIQIHPWFFAEGVVAAGQRNLAVFDVVAPESFHSFKRKIDREAEVVFCVNVPLRPLWQRREFFHIRHGRNGQPIFAKFVERDIISKAFADVIG